MCHSDDNDRYQDQEVEKAKCVLKSEARGHETVVTITTMDDIVTHPRAVHSGGDPIRLQISPPEDVGSAEGTEVNPAL